MNAADARTPSPPRALERLRHWQGELLRGRDFRDQAKVDARMRHWHNRALHSPGVSGGLAVRWASEGKRTSVQVEAGLAYDCAGRELALTRPREIEVPEEPPRGGSSFLLLLRRRQPPAGEADSVFAEPELAWRAGERLRPSHGVPLARVSWRDGRLLLDPRSDRRAARALARPRFASGETMPRATPWEVWLFDRRSAPGLQVRVDTKAAGFTSVPCYFAWAQAATWAAGGESGREAQIVLSPHVAEETPSGFRFRMVILPGEGVLDYAARAGLFVCWAGLEHGPAAPLFFPARERCCS